MAKAEIALVQTLYDAFARGDLDAAMAVMSPEIVWNEADNYPYAYGNPYIGPAAVNEGVFVPAGSDWADFTVNIEDILDAGAKLVAYGRYKGVYKKTGKPINAQVVHIWTVANGAITAFQQYADTYQVVLATEA